MSDPNDPLPEAAPASPPEAPPVEAPVATVAVQTSNAAVDPLEVPAASGAPYRVPAPPPEPAHVELPWVKPPRKPRPVIGPALSVFAVLLWTFVVAGQFTTSWLVGTPLNQTVAVAMVLLMTFTAWVAGIRLSRIVVPPRQTMFLFWRAIGIAVLASLLFFVCFAVAVVTGEASSGGHDVLIPFVLVMVSLLAAIVGPRLTSPTPLERTHRQRFVVVTLWITGTLVTLVAGVDLAAHG